MRRTPPAYNPFDDHDDPSEETPQNVRRISTTPGFERVQRRADVRPLHAARRPLPRRGPDPRVWFVRGSIGVAALAGLWLGLQALFPVSESQVTQAPPAATAPSVESVAVGAPEPPAAQAGAPAQPPATAANPEPAAPIGDRLPGLPTPDAAAPQQSAPAPVAAAPAPAQPAAAPAQPTAAPQPEARQEAPVQQPVGKPTLAPIPPPPGGAAQTTAPAQQAAQQAAQQQAAAAPKPQGPPPAAPPAAQATGGPFELSASASPVNPISEQAVVTITVRATQNGAALAGASCMATAYFRTNTVKQPDGGFRTNGNGVGSFTLDARGSTYGHYIPVDVTCTGRGGTVTARTGFTPVRGR